MFVGYLKEIRIQWGTIHIQLETIHIQGNDYQDYGDSYRLSSDSSTMKSTMSRPECSGAGGAGVRDTVEHHTVEHHRKGYVSEPPTAPTALAPEATGSI